MADYKNNKEPVQNKQETVASKHEQKPDEYDLGMDATAIDRLTIDKALKDELEEKGLVYRFVNRVQLKESGMSVTASLWKPYKRESKATGASELFGESPDGYVIRGDLILAVRKKELNEKFKQQLKQRNENSSKINEKHAQELRQTVGNKGKILKGYED